MRQRTLGLTRVLVVKQLNTCKIVTGTLTLMTKPRMRLRLKTQSCALLTIRCQCSVGTAFPTTRSSRDVEAAALKRPPVPLLSPAMLAEPRSVAARLPQMLSASLPAPVESLQAAAAVATEMGAADAAVLAAVCQGHSLRPTAIPVSISTTQQQRLIDMSGREADARKCHHRDSPAMGML